MQRVDRFDLLTELGRGGQGVVWLARDRDSGERIALKVLTHLGPGCDRALRRFQREASIVADFDHPGICRIVDTGISDGVPWIAMPFIQGESLQSFIARSHQQEATLTIADPNAAETQIELKFDEETIRAVRPVGHGLNLAEAILLFERIAEALHVAHEGGVIHRDIKPSNIMITDELQPVLLDFGLAKELEADGPSLTMSDEFFGTPAYMAPELLRQRAMAADRRADVWSLGVVLYEMVTGTRPFVGPTRESLYRAILRSEPAPARRLNPDISVQLDVIIETAISKELDRRYQTAGDLAGDLRRIRTGDTILARAPTPVAKIKRWARRRPAAAALTVVLALGVPALTTLAGYLLAQMPEVQAARDARERDRLDGLLATAWFEWSEGSKTKALGGFTSALESAPGDPEAIAGIALSLWANGQVSEAWTHMEKYASVVDRHPSLIPIKADIMYSLGQVEESRALRALQPPPNSAFDLYISGLRHLSRGHDGSTKSYKIAWERLRRAILMADRLHPNHYFQLAHAIGHVRSPDASHDIAEVLAKRWPDDASAHYWAGFALMPASATAAEPRMRKAIELGIETSVAHSNLGIILQTQKRYEDAIASFEEAIRLKPENTKPTIYIAQCEVSLGRPDDAESRLLTLLADHPKNWQALDLVAKIRRERKDWTGAREVLIKAVAVNPTRTLLFRLGYAEMTLDDTASAKKRFERILATFPKDARSRANLGHCQQKQGNLVGAVESYKQAISIQPDLKPPHANLCRVYIARGELDLALDERERFLAAVPRSAAAWREIAAHHLRWHEQQERASLTQALTSARRAHALSEAPDHPGRLLIARALMAMDRTEDAIKVLEAAIEIAAGDGATGPDVNSLKRLLRDARKSR